MNTAPQPSSTPPATLSDASPESPLAAILRHWGEGIKVIGRFIWFTLIFRILILPLELLLWFLNPKDQPVLGQNGFNDRAALALIPFILYVPIAAHFAARLSGHLRPRRP